MDDPETLSDKLKSLSSQVQQRDAEISSLKKQILQLRNGKQDKLSFDLIDTEKEIQKRITEEFEKKEKKFNEKLKEQQLKYEKELSTSRHMYETIANKLESITALERTIEAQGRDIKILEEEKKNMKLLHMEIIKQNQIESEIKHAEAKRKMVEEIKKVQHNVSLSYLEQMDNSQKLTFLRNNQLEKEIDYRSVRLEELILKNEKYEKKIFLLQEDLKNTNQSMSNMVEKNRNLSDMVRKLTEKLVKSHKDKEEELNKILLMCDLDPKKFVFSSILSSSNRESDKNKIITSKSMSKSYRKKKNKSKSPRKMNSSLRNENNINDIEKENFSNKNLEMNENFDNLNDNKKYDVNKMDFKIGNNEENEKIDIKGINIYSSPKNDELDKSNHLDNQNHIIEKKKSQTFIDKNSFKKEIKDLSFPQNVKKSNLSLNNENLNMTSNIQNNFPNSATIKNYENPFPGSKFISNLVFNDHYKGIMNRTSTTSSNKLSGFGLEHNLYKIYEIKLKNFENLLEKKESEYLKLKLSFDQINDKFSNYEKKYLNILSLYEAGLNKLIEEEENLRNFKLIDFNFDFNAFKNMEFCKLSPENKYSVLLILLNQIIPMININELESEFIKENVAMVKMKYFQDKLKNTSYKDNFFRNSVSNFNHNKLMKIGVNPASNNSKSHFIINGHENITAKYKIPLNYLKNEKLNLQRKLNIYEYQIAN